MEQHVTSPTVVGYWVLPGGYIHIAAIYKPNRLTRFLMRYLMQWKWLDE